MDGVKSVATTKDGGVSYPPQTRVFFKDADSALLTGMVHLLLPTIAMVLVSCATPVPLRHTPGATDNNCPPHPLQTCFLTAGGEAPPRIDPTTALGVVPYLAGLIIRRRESLDCPWLFSNWFSI